MDNKKTETQENYDFIYKDYLEAETGDADDLIFAPVKQDKTHSEK